MLSRTCALSLVILIALPFSAPFSTCDFATVFSVKSRLATSPSADRDGAGRESRSQAASLGDPARSHALPHTRVTSRSKLVATEVRGVTTTVDSPRASAYRGPLAMGFAQSRFVSPLRI
jgi:hypothetical protein